MLRETLRSDRICLVWAVYPSNRCCGDCPILLALGGHRTCRLATPSAWVGTPSAAGKVLPPINNNADEQYAVHGVVFSAVFYNHVRISVDGGMTFDGEGGGLSTPGEVHSGEIL
ncbi:VapA/VapB family virulence-associated protein [Rhodococcus hoagii]|nr:VapA/VapB family virulence-associated protein [Prescottella equi]